LITVQHFEHPPEAYPVTILMQGVLLHVGEGGAGPGIAHPIHRGKVLIVLDVGSNPEGNSGIVGPLDDGTVNHGKVVHSIRG
jgi:hypothetical protein